MKKIIILIVSFFVSESLLAQVQQVVYVGRDKNTNAPCKLYVNNVGYKNDQRVPENFYMDVLPRGFSHGIDSAGPFRLGTVADKPNILYSLQNADEMVLFFENGDYLTGEPSGFNVKWLHGNHFHYDVCRNLRRK